MPEPLQALATITSNLGWLFDPRVRDLFRSVDPDATDLAGLDPLGVLNRCSGQQLAALAEDRRFIARADALAAELTAELSGPTWAQATGDLPLVAYFSPEFGLAASVPQYSGGLGVLAGDHLKAAADLGLPIVGIGLFYRSGYFRQTIDTEGRQHELFPGLHPTELALSPVDDLRVSVDIGEMVVEATIWKAQVGVNSLYLLDTFVPGETGPDQLVNDRLYGGGSEERIRQELLLGVGGHRALRALGIDAEVFHLNEGHAGFLSLERIRVAMTEQSMSFAEAVEAIRPSMLFTTHTPVPAGIDRFPHELMEQYFGWWCDATGVAMSTLLALGDEPGGDPEVFNLAHMSLRLCGDANGVSILHGDVSRRMFAPLWPGVEVDDVPIGAVTNGVHAPTFMADDIRALLIRNVGEDWELASHDRFRAFHASADADLWAARNAGRAQLIDFVRYRARRAATRRHSNGTRSGDGASGPDTSDHIDTLLDPDVLTIGFARRFATYKRATLLLHDHERLRHLLTSDRPIQLVFAGKAHPADEPGKELLRTVAHLASDPELRRRVVFVEDYDLDAGRMLTRGVDIWLNNPLRPMEACGTSGMKAALNGILNLSVRDGWWDEAYTPEVGWAIPTMADGTDPDERDRVESEWLYEIIENEVVPLFYDRDGAGIPTGWTTRMASCIEALVPQFHAGRMVRDYTLKHYVPAAQRASSLTADHAAGARELAAWKQRMRDHWHKIHVNDLQPPVDSHVDESITLEVGVYLDGLSPDDVEVSFVVGDLADDGDIARARIEPMHLADGEHGDHHHDNGEHRYVATFMSNHPGTMGYAVRVVPRHRHLERWADLGLVSWAE